MSKYNLVNTGHKSIYKFSHRGSTLAAHFAEWGMVYITQVGSIGSICAAVRRAVASDTRGHGSNPVIGNFYETFMTFIPRMYVTQIFRRAVASDTRGRGSNPVIGYFYQTLIPRMQVNNVYKVLESWNSLFLKVNFLPAFRKTRWD